MRLVFELNRSLLCTCQVASMFHREQLSVEINLQNVKFRLAPQVLFHLHQAKQNKVHKIPGHLYES